ncbi:MAG TPA: DUF2071 domain-containing protein [Pyrinomonadaceae bacterium]
MDNIDRLSIRERPAAMAIGRQTWGKLLFMHWRIPAERLRAAVPAELEIDTYEGEAWIAVVPFTIWGMRASFLPPVPGLSEMHELNVRTYVHYKGVPGVLFLSLDATSLLAVLGARTFFLLPYYTADMSLRQEGDRIVYHSRRTHADAPAAVFDATWRTGTPLEASRPGSLEFFLTERYCFFTVHEGAVYRCRIHHPPWPLTTAEVSAYHSTMIESHGLPTPAGPPLLHYAEEITVDIWPLERV